MESIEVILGEDDSNELSKVVDAAQIRSHDHIDFEILLCLNFTMASSIGFYDVIAGVRRRLQEALNKAQFWKFNI